VALGRLIDLRFVIGVFVFVAIIKVVGISIFVVSIIAIITTAASPRGAVALLDGIHL
jgi:hypothetical protein